MSPVRDPFGRDRHVAGLDDGFESAAFVGRVALDCLHEVGDQVAPAFQLYINLGPGILQLVAEADQAVVRADNPAGNAESEQK